MVVRVEVRSSEALTWKPVEGPDVALPDTGDAVEFGRHPSGRGAGGVPYLRLGQADHRAPVPYVSARAGRLDVGRPGEPVLLTNLSQTHDLLVRPWGASPDGDLRVPRNDGRTAPARLDSGLWLVRNGRDYQADGRPLPDPGDRYACWLSVRIRSVGGVTPTRRPIGATTRPLQGGDPARAYDDPPGFTDRHLKALVYYFVEFVAFPPRVAPRQRSGPEVERVAGSPQHQALADARSVAARLGYTGRRADEALLRWMLQHHHLQSTWVQDWMADGVDDFGL